VMRNPTRSGKSSSFLLNGGDGPASGNLATLQLQDALAFRSGEGRG